MALRGACAAATTSSPHHHLPLHGATHREASCSVVPHAAWPPAHRRRRSSVKKGKSTPTRSNRASPAKSTKSQISVLMRARRRSYCSSRDSPAPPAFVCRSCLSAQAPTACACRRLGAPDTAAPRPRTRSGTTHRLSTCPHAGHHLSSRPPPRAGHRAQGLDSTSRRGSSAATQASSSR